MPPKQSKEEERKEKLTIKQDRLNELNQAAAERKESGDMSPMSESERKERDTLKTTIKNLQRTGEARDIDLEQKREYQKNYQRVRRKRNSDLQKAIKEQEEKLEQEIQMKIRRSALMPDSEMENDESEMSGLEEQKESILGRQMRMEREKNMPKKSALGQELEEKRDRQYQYSLDLANQKMGVIKEKKEEKEGVFESDEKKQIKVIIDEAKMLSGGSHATLFNGDTLNMSANDDTADDEKHDNGGTESGLERYRKSSSDTDIPDLSDFNYSVFSGFGYAGDDILPREGRDPYIIESGSDFRRRRREGINARESAFSGDYAGSQESLMANGYGMPALPNYHNINENKYGEVFESKTSIYKEGHDLEPLSDMSDNGSIMSEISSHINLRDDSMDSTDNKPTMEDLIKRMKGVNRTNTNFKDFKKKQKWNPTTGRGNKLKGIKTMSNSLSTIREAQIPYKQPNRTYKGDAVNLVRMGNAKMVGIINQYQP